MQIYHVATSPVITLFLHYNVLYEFFFNHVGEHKKKNMKKHIIAV